MRDMTTNLIQPFWAIPILTVAGLRFGDIMGYCFILTGLLCLVALFTVMLLGQSERRYVAVATT